MSAVSYDVLVIGGGPAGLGAAVAAARCGARTGLIERHPILGGMGTAALVNNFCNAHKAWQGEGKPCRAIIGGVFAELRQRLIGRRAIVMTDLSCACWMEPYDPAIFAAESTALCRQAGVEVRHGRQPRKATFADQQPAVITLDDGDEVRAATVVDTTGDAAVAALAKVPCTFGREEDGAVMPLTFCYVFGPIDLDAVRRQRPDAIRIDAATGLEYLFITGLHEEVAEARRQGLLTIPRDHVVSIASIPGRPAYATVNFGRVFCDDPTDPARLAAAEAEGRRQVDEGIAFFRRCLPGFADIRLVELGLQIGVRESRQIIGLHRLTGDELVAGRQHADVIAQCCYGIDIHDPRSTGQTIRQIGDPYHYDIPLRCLIPRDGPGNLLVGGRCISATHEAMSSLRVAPTCMATGEAAGVTAAFVAQRGLPAHCIPAGDVQARLRATGGILD